MSRRAGGCAALAWVRAAAVAMACAGCAADADPAAGSLTADRWTHPAFGVSLVLPPEGRWTDRAADFRGGLPGTLLEGHASGVDLAVVGYRAGPWLAAQLAGGTGLDVFTLLAPPAADAAAPLARLPSCGGAAWQALDGMDRAALPPRGGAALVLHAWNGEASARRALLARLACRT